MQVYRIKYPQRVGTNHLFPLIRAGEFNHNFLKYFRCRGTTKWVHQACIQRWVDEKQKGNNMAAVACPQCGTKYVIHLPAGSYIVTLLDNCELLIQRVSPIIAGGVCVGSLYLVSIIHI